MYENIIFVDYVSVNTKSFNHLKPTNQQALSQAKICIIITCVYAFIYVYMYEYVRNLELKILHLVV